MPPFVFTSLVRRYMKYTDNYHDVRSRRTADTSRLPTLEEGEELVGWYQNPEPYEGSVLYFTSTSIISQEPEQTSRVRAEDIVGFDVPDSKTEALGVHLQTKEGQRFIRIAGHHGRSYSDAFCLIPLVHAMIGPARKPTQRSSWKQALEIFDEGKHYEAALHWCKSMSDVEKAHWAANVLQRLQSDDPTKLIAETLSLFACPHAWEEGRDLFERVRERRSSHSDYRSSSTLPGLGLRLCELTCKLIFNATAPSARFDADTPGVIVREIGENSYLFTEEAYHDLVTVMFT